MYGQRFLRILVGLSLGLLASASCNHDRAEHGTARAAVGATAVSAEIDVDQAVHRPVPGKWPAAAFDGRTAGTRCWSATPGTATERLGPYSSTRMARSSAMSS